MTCSDMPRSQLDQVQEKEPEPVGPAPAEPRRDFEGPEAAVSSILAALARSIKRCRPNRCTQARCMVAGHIWLKVISHAGVRHAWTFGTTFSWQSAQTR